MANCGSSIAQADDVATSNSKWMPELINGLIGVFILNPCPPFPLNSQRLDSGALAKLLRPFANTPLILPELQLGENGVEKYCEPFQRFSWCRYKPICGLTARYLTQTSTSMVYSVCGETVKTILRNLIAP